MNYNSMGLTLDGPPTIGSLLGTVGRKSLLDNISEAFGSRGFFGSAADILRDQHITFHRQVIAPMYRISTAAQQLMQNILRPDQIRPFLVEEDLYAVPESMQLGMVMYAPVRKLLEEGKISGFGYNPELLPEEDLIGRLLENMSTSDAYANVVENKGDLVLTGTYYSDDPNFSADELDCFESMRDMVDRTLAHTDKDPTSYPNDRGQGTTTE